MTKKKVLIFIDWFLPGYKAGGPIQSVSNLILQLGAEFDFSVVTSNRDLGELKPYASVKYNRWINNEKYRVMYLDEKQQNLKSYRELLKENDYDAVYFNSLFSINFTLKPLLLLRNSGYKIILAPRGMLGEGALQLKKRKKQLFLSLFKSSGIYKKIIWHATAASEAEEIKKHFGENSKTKIATNLSALIGGDLVSKIKQVNSANFFFLSRISKKKNLKAALHFLSGINDRFQISFSIIGPVEEVSYWRECEEIIKNLPKNISVKYAGAVPNHQLKEKLKGQHFMLLPTFHENFGHVIMESWQNACPVIISDQTPWANLESQKTGFNILLNKEEEFIKAIEQAAGMDQAEYDIWSQASYNFAKVYCNDPKAVEASRELFS